MAIIFTKLVNRWFYPKPSLYLFLPIFYAGGAGTSDSGNIGWKLVQHAAEIGPIIFKNHVPPEAAQQLFEGLGHFLIAINSKFVLDPVKFGRLCAHVDGLMIQWVGWHPGVPRLESSINKSFEPASFLNQNL